MDAFDLIVPLALIHYLVSKTNQRAEMFFAKDSPTNFLLEWVKMTSSKFYGFEYFLFYVLGVTSRKA